MASSRVPSNSVDHVGSLKRPPELVAAWREWEAGKLPPEKLREVQDKAIREAVAMQERMGLPIVTDGEFRRGGWSRGFLNAVEGFDFRASKLVFRNDEGVTTPSPAPMATKKVRRARPIVTEDFKFLQSVAKNRVKVTMPTPSHMHFGQFKDAVDRTVYPDVEAYWDDMVAVFQQEIKELYAAGCRYLQLDEVPLALLCDNNIRALAKSEGDDPDKLVALYIDVLNRAVAGRPADLTIGMHLCRGNMESMWMGDGGYAPIGEALFKDCDVDAYLLEYDSRRAGDFAPLRHLPIGKRAYLGIISTKNPALEIAGRSHAPHRRSGPPCADGSARHLPAVRLCQRGNVEVRRHAEQGHDRHSDAQDRASGRRRPPCMGPCVMQALTELDSYGLFTAEAVQNPYPYYKALRERERVHWSERARAWYFTHYPDVYELQDRPDLSVDRIETLYSYLPRTNPERFSDIVEHYHRWLLYRDDAYHDRLKALFLKAMTPRAVERLRPMLQRRVDVLLDELEKRDAFDAYLDFAARIPTQVMLDLLGLPDSDEALMRHWSDRCSNFLFQPVAPDKEAMAREQREILDAQQAYFMQRVDERRRRPGEDMISAMVQAKAGGERLTDLEILATCNMMATAGRRHVAQRNRHVVMVAAPIPRSARQAQGRSRPHQSRRRGVPALRRTDPARHPHRARRFRNGRQANPQGRASAHHDRRGKPRSGAVCRPGPDRHHPRPQPPRDARPRRALLPRRRAGAA